MSKESMEIGKWVRATLVQMGVDTGGLDIFVTGTSVSLKGELKRLKPSFAETETSKKQLMESVRDRLRSKKEIKRVQFL